MHFFNLWLASTWWKSHRGMSLPFGWCLPWGCSPGVPLMHATPCSCRPVLRLTDHRGFTSAKVNPPNVQCGYQLHLCHAASLFPLHGVTYQYSYSLKYFRSFKENSKLSFPWKPLSEVFQVTAEAFKQGLSFTASLCWQPQLLSPSGIF